MQNYAFLLERIWPRAKSDCSCLRVLSAVLCVITVWSCRVGVSLELVCWFTVHYKISIALKFQSAALAAGGESSISLEAEDSSLFVGCHQIQAACGTFWSSPEHPHWLVMSWLNECLLSDFSRCGWTCQAHSADVCLRQCQRKHCYVEDGWTIFPCQYSCRCLRCFFANMCFHLFAEACCASYANIGCYRTLAFAQAMRFLDRDAFCSALSYEYQ